MEQTRIGLIGVGRFCPNYHIPNLIQRRDVEITAVCDISQDRLDNLPESLGASQTSRDYRDLLDPDLVDGVVVSTPNQYHYEQCKLALERRIPVLVDKPTTVTVAHAKELTALSQAQECLLMTAFTRRFMASTEYVRSQLLRRCDPGKEGHRERTRCGPAQPRRTTGSKSGRGDSRGRKDRQVGCRTCVGDRLGLQSRETLIQTSVKSARWPSSRKAIRLPKASTRISSVRGASSRRTISRSRSSRPGTPRAFA